MKYRKLLVLRADTGGDGTAEVTGTDLTSWGSYTDGVISFSLADAAIYRTF